MTSLEMLMRVAFSPMESQQPLKDLDLCPCLVHLHPQAQAQALHHSPHPQVGVVTVLGVRRQVKVVLVKIG